MTGMVVLFGGPCDGLRIDDGGTDMVRVSMEHEEGCPLAGDRTEAVYRRGVGARFIYEGELTV